ncbi:amino acid adenylation domain-containing protein [Paenibacillus sp. JSM ZJ436]|uniref:amino acid adenylation domain-containing protein n=1 Tax=Paenibacillus sp. JSM ZJ436 TaxID=3376190 RepID=UPI0037A4A7CD
MTNERPVLFHEFLLQHVQTRSEVEAIIHRGKPWTYRQLNERVLQFAVQLKKIGIKAGERILLEMHPTPTAVALLIAISKLGAVFVPVSPDSPQARLEDIAVLTGAVLHIQDKEGERVLETQGICQIHVEAEWLIHRTSLRLQPNETQVTRVSSEVDLCYMIFTSGTTGLPKGIMMSHQAVVAFYKGMIETCGVSAHARIGTISPLQFDLSLLDLGLALGSGAALVQVPNILVHQPKRMVRYLCDHQVTQMNGVPSIWRHLLQKVSEPIYDLLSLEAVLFAGESFPVIELVKLKSILPGLSRIINCFGQSESVACTFHDVKPELESKPSCLSIGRGIPGAEMLLIDEEGRPIKEVGVIGELYLGGPILFSGYWKDEELTQRALVPHPLRPEGKEKVFRTGDLAYMGTNGHFFYKGRKDHQVKVQGNRVELGEIQNRLLTHPDVHEAEIILQSTEAGAAIWAFLVPAPRTTPVKEELRKYCALALPAYMLPSRFFFIDVMPVTINGKIDTKALLAYSRQATS